MTAIGSLTRGERNNNPGNIKKSSIVWQGLTEQQRDNIFLSFTNAEFGIRALAKILLTYFHKYGLKTVADIVTRWAPPTENITDAYINSVASSLGVTPDEIINLHDSETLTALTKAIIKHENGRVNYADATINNGVSMALS